MTSRCLTILHCDGCDRFLAPLTCKCPGCGDSRLAVVASSGQGTIVSWRHTVVPGFARTPIIAIVELDDGPWLYTLIDYALNTMPEKLSRVVFRCKEPGERFPHFGLG